MPKSVRIRDTLHGFIELNEHELKIVNSRPFQRLRHVRQLGMAHFVYPGANHTRFEHCLGCLWITDKMYERINTGVSADLWSDVRHNREVDALRQIARFAALTHDLGHAPFSHTAEDLFRAGDGSDRPFSHESQTARLIRETEVSEAIRSADIDPEEVIYVATSEDETNLDRPKSRHDLLILNTLIAGELGSDRCDYLLRDAYHSGQPAGRLDIDRLIQQFSLIEHEGAIYPGLKEGGRIAAEQMIANRYAAYIDLYFHKTKRAYERHLISFLREHLPEGHFPTSIDRFLALDDSAIEFAIMQAAADPDAPGHLHALAFFERNHFRRVFERVPTDKQGLLPEQIAQFEHDCEEELDGKGFVDIVQHSGTKVRENRILVEMHQRVRYLDELAELIPALSRYIWRLRVYSKEDRKQEMAAWCSRTWGERFGDGRKR